MKKIMFLAAVAVCAVLPANAAQAAEPRSTEVGYSDLDLASDDGIATLDRRIGKAVNWVCDYSPRSADRLFAPGARLCKSETLASVQPVRDAVVAAYRRGTVQVIAKLDIKAPTSRQ